ncbi:MAG: polyprenyl synthetase family protein [Dehalococcoidales bacterium]|nr:polyprenyl synthetase family protein [Dehalococcoidales bacterium]
MAYQEACDRHTWQAQWTDHLARELGSVLSLVPPGTGLAELLKEPLSEARRGLAPQARKDTPWHLLPLMVCESVSGDYKTALPVAAAFQLMATAGDVFDDIADKDSSKSLPATYGFGEAINAATALVVLAELAISRLKNLGVPSRKILSIFRVFNSYSVKACTGQHLDLSALKDTRITESRYLKILSLKSASQIECGCHVGALAGGARMHTIRAYRKFGQNLGMAAQITNDMTGITSGKDIANRKLTLPVVFAINTLDKHQQLQIIQAYSSPRRLNKDDIEQIQNILQQTGALYYANLKRHIYKQQAAEALAGTDNQFSTDWVRLFLE